MLNALCCVVMSCLVSIDAAVRSLNSWNRSNRSCACRWALRLRVKQMLSWGELNVCKNKVKRIPWTWIISIFLCTVFITCVIGIFLIAMPCLAMQCYAIHIKNVAVVERYMLKHKQKHADWKIYPIGQSNYFQVHNIHTIPYMQTHITTYRPQQHRCCVLSKHKYMLRLRILCLYTARFDFKRNQHIFSLVGIRKVSLCLLKMKVKYET